MNDTDCPPPDFSNYEGPDGGTKHNVAVQLKCKTGYGLETDDQDRVCNYGNFIPSFDTAPASCLQSLFIVIIWSLYRTKCLDTNTLIVRKLLLYVIIKMYARWFAIYIVSL